MLDDLKYRDGEVSVAGVRVRYRVAGPDNDRTPLVLVHGTAGSVDGHFGYIFPMMAYRQKVIALDWSDTEGATLELADLVAQVRAVIGDAVPVGPVTLLGYSLGACVAAQTAAELPGKVANLILVAGWLKTDTHQQMRNRIWRALRDQDSASITEYMTFCAFSPGFMNMKSLPEMVAAAGMLKMSGFVDRQMDLNTRIDIAEACETITAKTLVIGCTFDMMVPKHHSKQLFGAIEDARYTEIPSGHAVVHERAAELFHHIDMFTRAPGAHPAGTIIPAQKP
ncbi:alpha/beta hydrolase [Pseudooceanicola sp. CBS1P-1]|uniref:Alpha/beta fold hydrolase n=1 Tax=Pseudooceanicola albus TaxID=2692189 RepID=A0A6L7G7A6_9RHOB|nr:MULTISPECIES: alpha/beta hydrolase [Pseudooceanicola]MBT9386027.1 alpha/beta hydrolase [Pseudooceanicola endophyticus]MXN19552.1 alpha/beta fold hydrolase [Pseudooceanicola albus]